MPLPWGPCLYMSFTWPGNKEQFLHLQKRKCISSRNHKMISVFPCLWESIFTLGIQVRFRYATRVHIEPSWHRKWLNSRLCCSQQSRPSAVCLATKIPKSLMCPATSEALERPFPLPLPPEEMGASRRQAEYLWVELDCSKLVLWPPEGASTDDTGKKNLLQAGILSGDTIEYISQQIWLLNRCLGPGSPVLQGRQYRGPQKRSFQFLKMTSSI